MTKSSRATNIQVPGAAPNEQQAGGNDTSAGGGQATAQLDAAGSPMRNPHYEGLFEGETQEQADARRAAANAAASPAFDLEKLRAQIREEEQARARAELANQIQAASTVIGASDATAPAAAAPAAAPLTKGDYKNMRADQVDPKTLSAPVMTRDGWVCPVPPEKK